MQSVKLYPSTLANSTLTLYLRRTSNRPPSYGLSLLAARRLGRRRPVAGRIVLELQRYAGFLLSDADR